MTVKTVTGLKEVTGLEVTYKKRKVIIDPDEVYKLAQLHCSTRDMGEWFGVDHKILLDHFSELIKRGKEDTRQKLRAKQLEVAMKGNVPMLIWMGKQVLKQAQDPAIEDLAQEDIQDFIQPIIIKEEGSNA